MVMAKGIVWSRGMPMKTTITTLGSFVTMRDRVELDSELITPPYAIDLKPRGIEAENVELRKTIIKLLMSGSPPSFSRRDLFIELGNQ